MTQIDVNHIVFDHTAEIDHFKKEKSNNKKRLVSFEFSLIIEDKQQSHLSLFTKFQLKTERDNR